MSVIYQEVLIKVSCKIINIIVMRSIAQQTKNQRFHALFFSFIITKTRTLGNIKIRGY